jgi:predicted nucleic acid-binding protein
LTTRIYFDASVYVKHFKDEDGSESVNRIIRIAQKNKQLKIFMSFWTINESITAIDKYFRKKVVTSENRDKIIATILASSVKYLQNYPNFVFVPLTSSIVRDSISLIRSLHISADDALHVCTATKRRCKYFIFQDRPLKHQVANRDTQGMTMIDITNLSDMKILFEQIEKYESFTSEEWRQKSIKGEVCAVAMCPNPPKNQCTTCFVHYCYDHIKNHYHGITDEEIERRNKEKESLK